jgi:hypothetical protein
MASLFQDFAIKTLDVIAFVLELQAFRIGTPPGPSTP